MSNYIDDVYTLYYYKDTNTVVDEDGKPIFNIFDIINPNMLMLFKLKKEEIRVYGNDGQIVRLIWPDDEEDNQL